MTIQLIDHLLADLPDAPVVDVSVGLFWTAAVVELAGQRRCGLASSLRGEEAHGVPAVAEAGRLMQRSARELAAWARRGPASLAEASIGMATLNAVLPLDPARWVEINAADVIAQHGAGRRVALVGHFPFVDALRPQVGALWVLEQRPQGDDLPASAAPEIIPQADVLAITGTTLINGTFPGLMALRRPDAVVLVLGPSTPLSPILFDYGVHLLSGAVVEDVDTVLCAVRQGANFQQTRRAGVRLVTMTADLRR
jgi:hypothetical protein